MPLKQTYHKRAKEPTSRIRVQWLMDEQVAHDVQVGAVVRKMKPGEFIAVLLRHFDATNQEVSNAR